MTNEVQRNLKYKQAEKQAARTRVLINLALGAIALIGLLILVHN